jgi:hypothetical protein
LDGLLHVYVSFFRCNEERNPVISFELNESISVGADVLENEHDVVPSVDIQLLVGVEVFVLLFFHVGLFHHFSNVYGFPNLSTILPLHVQKVLFLHHVINVWVIVFLIFYFLVIILVGAQRNFGLQRSINESSLAFCQ